MPRCLPYLFLLTALLVSLGANESPGPSTDRLVNDRCPVMTEEFTSPLHELETGGVTVRFCCDKCRARFEDDPAPYLSHLPQVTPAVAQAIVAGNRANVSQTNAKHWLDRWMRPIFLAVAGLLSAWLIARIARRNRRVSQTPLGK